MCYKGADWDWDKEDPFRFNPLDDTKSKSVDIAILEAIESMRLFFTGKTGVQQMDNDEFALILDVAAASARRRS